MASPSSTVSDDTDSTIPRSSSVTVTARSADTPVYSPPAAVWVSVTESSVSSASSLAVTVTDCGLAQSVSLNVSVLAPRVTSVFCWPDTVTVTVSVGSVASLTV